MSRVLMFLLLTKSREQTNTGSLQNLTQNAVIDLTLVI